MIPILADATPTAEALREWLFVVAFLAGIIYALLGIAASVKKLRSSDDKVMNVRPPDPLMVQAADRPPTEAECEGRHARIESEFEQERGARKELAAKMDEELGRERSARKKIHEDFAAMAGDVKVLQAETGRQTATLGELKVEVQSTNARIDAVPGRVINLLRETKGLIQ